MDEFQELVVSHLFDFSGCEQGNEGGSSAGPENVAEGELGLGLYFLKARCLQKCPTSDVQHWQNLELGICFPGS